MIPFSLISLLLGPDFLFLPPVCLCYPSVFDWPTLTILLAFMSPVFSRSCIHLQKSTSTSPEGTESRKKGEKASLNLAVEDIRKKVFQSYEAFFIRLNWENYGSPREGAHPGGRCQAQVVFI
jgi:hypothetical protein